MSKIITQKGQLHDYDNALNKENKKRMSMTYYERNF